MKIMVITPYLPHRMVGHGGGSAVRDLAKHLACDHEVLLVSMVRPRERQHLAEVEELGVKVLPLDFPDTTATGFKRLHLLGNRALSSWRGLFSGFPAYVEKYWSSDNSRQILQAVSEFKPDAIQIEYLQMALYARDLAKLQHPRPKIILNSHELGSIPRHRRAARTTNSVSRRWYEIQAGQWQKLQVAACGWVDAMLCVTEEDRRAFEAMGGSGLLTVPLGMDLENLKPDHQPTAPPTCLFVGSYNHRPNVLAADLLVQKIWPEVRQAIPEAQLILAGRGSRKHLADSKGPTDGISALGFVEDLTPLFRQSALFVAPLPEGGGIKIKILEAMARGIPTVTTAVGAEGIAGPEDDCLIITDPSEGFAAAIIIAINDPETAERARRARNLMEKKFSWKAITRRLEDIYRKNY